MYLYFFWLCSILSTVSASNIHARIVGGDPARAGQFPFAAAIYVQTNTSKFFCGGTLLGNQWVITAGHCVYNAVLFTIQLGSTNLNSEDSNRVILATSTYILHPDFNPDTIENDIGVIKFREPVQTNGYLMTVQLIEWNMTDGYSVSVLGWGQVNDSDPELSNELRYASLTTISNNDCSFYYGSQITDNMVCVVGNYNEGTCTGDNGSGLIGKLGSHSTLVGVASFISGNGCESTDPSGYTRMFPYYKWIRNVTESG